MMPARGPQTACFRSLYVQFLWCGHRVVWSLLWQASRQAGKQASRQAGKQAGRLATRQGRHTAAHGPQMATISMGALLGKL
eukprot:4898029-Karenia_brevis.AAC.1